MGFTGGITTVLNEYFDSFLPDAVNTSMHLRERGGEEQLVFTTHAFVVSLFLDCPAGRGLHCPTPTAKAYIEGAIRDGVISLHAFPFNAELGMYDASLIEAGVELAGSLHARYGRPRPTVLSQRDVPGMTQAVVTVLRKLGVEAVSIGVNNAAQPPGVPPIFRWQAPAGGASVIGMVHPGGYAEIDIDRLEGGGCDDPPCTRHAHEYVNDCVTCNARRVGRPPGVHGTAATPRDGRPPLLGELGAGRAASCTALLIVLTSVFLTSALCQVLHGARLRRSSRQRLELGQPRAPNAGRCSADVQRHAEALPERGDRGINNGRLCHRSAST